jgi:hypothetical protein
MNTIKCDGLSGANPLHMLATLGMFRIVAIEDPDAKLSWSRTHPYTPSVKTSLDSKECQESLLRQLGIRGSVALNTRLARIGNQLAALQATIDSLEGKGKDLGARRKELKNALKKEKKRAKRLGKIIDLKKRKPIARALGRKHTFASSSDCIHKIPREKLQEMIRSDLSLLWQSLLPSLTADMDAGAKTGYDGILRSKLSFSNGGSGKAILKDWLTNLAFLRKPLPDDPHLLGIALQSEKITGLMWDPIEMRDHALRWTNPEDEATESIPLLNVLAFVGLSFFTVLPAKTGRKENTIGVTSDAKKFLWPIWHTPLSVDIVTSLITAAPFDNENEAQHSARGIEVVMGSTIFSANKRNFFTIPQPA